MFILRICIILKNGKTLLKYYPHIFDIFVFYICYFFMHVYISMYYVFYEFSILFLFLCALCIYKIFNENLI